MRTVFILIFGILMIGCKKKSSPKPPEVAQLVFPNKSSECTTGNDLNENTSEIEFKWVASDHTETYELNVINLNTNTTQKINTKALTAKVPIAKGEPFEWFVKSKNTKVVDVATSETWRFYNAGQETSYAPFPAQGIHPKSGASVFKDINNEVALEWFGDDIENDIESYELYFSTNSPPETLIESFTANKNTKNVTVAASTTYYWKVVTIDRLGHKSDSGAFIFKVL